MARVRQPASQTGAGGDLEFARQVLRLEAQAIEAVCQRLGESFVRAVDLVLGCSGRMILSGVGKAGIIGRKIAATLASTGTPAFFMHPTDALHGDLGMAAAGDVALLLSYSGQTAEMVQLLPHLKNVGARVIVLSGSADGPLCQPGVYDVLLDIGALDEACPQAGGGSPLGLAPTCSTTAMLAVGDALALTVLRRRGFNGEDYIRFHPAGSLGRKLLSVEEVMRTGSRLPLVSADTPIGEVIGAISRARAGSAPVVDATGRLLGIFTDGDFRRLWLRLASGNDSRLPAGQAGKRELPVGEGMLTPVGQVMTAPCLSILRGRLVGEAMGLMRNKHINELPVVDDGGRVVGLLDVQDIVGIDV